MSSYHARLSAHLASLLAAHIDEIQQRREAGGMVTDMKQLAERDREHATAWRVEGYKRYMGGVKEGFVLGRVPRAAAAEREPEPLGEGVGEGEGEGARGGMRGRKRRGTEGEGGREAKRRDDRGRDLVPHGSSRRTVSAGPATPTSPDDPPSLPGPSNPESAKAAEERRERARTPPLAYVPSPTSPNSSIRHVDGRAFTLQQPPPPRRPFRRPVQPRMETTMEDGNPSNASLVLASAHLVPRVADEQSSEEVRRLDAAKVKALGTSLSASSALAATPHALLPFPQPTTSQPIPCASPSVGSLTSASLGCAHHALTPLPAGEIKTHASPSAKLSRDLQMSSAAEQGGTQSAQIRRKEEDEMWDCFMQLGGTPAEGT
ncbi:hypothetical protein NliqN6_2953 [Naganishia liquefaciens]|uniref:Uncharacterized protein n=1 Tax=Naganishia liquefaciens TaxID=104408 RepID=A0A8H3TSC3_9TREE|nr:hypothetical protein NliqN6_2953 [Naganishia liquefaciens]